MIDTEARHDSISSKSTFLNVFAKFGILISNKLAAVVDNVTNMTRTVALLNSECSDEAEIDEDSEFYSELENVEFDRRVHHMRCTAHTLQLGVRNGLRKTLCISVRCKNSSNCNDIFLKKCAGKEMVIDMVTRWSSTYLMATRLLELKDAAIDLLFSEIRFVQHDGEELKRLVEVLKIPYDATIALQSENLTPSSSF